MLPMLPMLLAAAAGCVAFALLVYAWARLHSTELVVARVLSARVLTEALGERFPGTRVASVRVVRVAKCGDGHASTTDRVTIDCDYARATAVPRRLVVKLILLPAVYRMGATEAMITAAGRVGRAFEGVGLDWVVWYCLNVYSFYFPHAPDAM